MGVAKLFAFIGLKAIDDLAGDRHVREYTDSQALCFIASVRNLSADASYSLLPRHAPQLLGPLPALAISKPSLRIVDDLLVATLAAPPRILQPTKQPYPRAVPALLAMRYGGVLPGAAMTAPDQYASSIAAVERFISEIGAALK